MPIIDSSLYTPEIGGQGHPCPRTTVSAAVRGHGRGHGYLKNRDRGHGRGHGHRFFCNRGHGRGHDHLLFQKVIFYWNLKGL